MVPFIIPFILYPLSAVLTMVIAIFGWYNRKNSISQPFILLMVATSIWTIGDWLITLTSDPITNYVINTAIYPAVVTVPVAWFLVILFYTGYDQYLSRMKITLLFLIPAFNVFLVATNPMHFLFYSSITPDIVDNFVIWHFNHGLLFPLTVIYSYSLVCLAFLLIISRLFGPTDLYRRQTFVLFLASFIPFACNLIYVVNPGSNPVIDLTPFSFMIVGVLIALGIIRYQLFSSVPLAYASLFSSMHDGVFATDITFRIIDLNPVAIRICGWSSRDAIGTSIRDIMPAIKIPDEDTYEIKERRQEITLYDERGKRYYEVSDFALRSIKKPIGWIFTLRDISVRKIAQESFEQANKKLSLLSSITRHDILNQVTRLQGYLDFSLQEIPEGKIHEYLKKCQAITGTIQNQIEFTRIYEEIGASSPIWQNVSLIIRKIKRDLPMVMIGYHVDLDGVMIFADPLFEKIVFTLVENTVRHGEKATDAWFSYQITESGLTLLYEDNGIGVDDQDKEKIFLKQFGKNTGYGLFIAREILSITGMSIRETGIPGKGVRFEIYILQGAWKIENSVVSPE